MSLVAVESELGNINDVGVRPINPKFVIVLDKSGSMTPIRNSILQAVNDLIDEQKKLSEELKDNATLTLITFSSESQTIMRNIPFTHARHLERSDYETDGYTALHDAIGTGILQHEDENNVVFVIVTDGQENSSKQWTQQNVNAAIEAKKALGWNFIYLANDLSVAKDGDSMGIGAANVFATTSQTNNIAVGFENMPNALTRQVSCAFAAFRQSSHVPNLNSSASSEQDLNSPPIPVRSTGNVDITDHYYQPLELKRTARVYVKKNEDSADLVDSDDEEKCASASVGVASAGVGVGVGVASAGVGAGAGAKDAKDELVNTVVNRTSSLMDSDVYDLDFAVQHPKS